MVGLRWFLIVIGVLSKVSKDRARAPGRERVWEEADSRKYDDSGKYDGGGSGGMPRLEYF